MADIGVDPWQWSSTPGSNSPSGATNISTGLDDNLRAIQAGHKASAENLSSVAGTDTITATFTGLTAYATGLRVKFIPAATNTGATTLNVTSLGAKNVFWNGVACVGGEIRQSIPVEMVYDGTQFHIVANGFNAPFLDTHAIVEGGTDRTKKVAIEVDGLTTATTRTITMPDANVDLQYSRAASDTVAGALEIATQAEIETGTDTARAVVAGRVHFAQGVAKGWVFAGVTGSSVVSYNVTSITDGGAGTATVNWATDFSGDNHVPVASTISSSAAVVLRVNAIAAGTTQVVAFNSTTGAAADPDGYMIANFGDFA